MPLSIDIDRILDLTTFTLSGEIKVNDPIDALGEYYKDNPTRKAIWDFREVSGNRVSSEELRQMIMFAKQHEGLRKDGKTALVAGTDLDFGLARMADSLAAVEDFSVKIRTFRSMEEAAAWLDE